MIGNKICIKKSTAGIILISGIFLIGFVVITSKLTKSRQTVNSRASEKITGVPIEKKQISTLILRDLKKKAENVVKTVGYEGEIKVAQEERKVEEARKALMEQTKKSGETLSNYGDKLRDEKFKLVEQLVEREKMDESQRKELEGAQGVLLIEKSNVKQAEEAVTSRTEEVEKAKEIVKRTQEIVNNSDGALLNQLRSEVVQLQREFQNSMDEVNIALGELITKLNQNNLPFIPQRISSEWALELVDAKSSFDLTRILQSVNTVETSVFYGPVLYISTSTKTAHENLKEKLSLAFENKIKYDGRNNTLNELEKQAEIQDMNVFKVAVQLGYEKALSDLEESRSKFETVISSEKTTQNSVELLQVAYDKVHAETLNKQREKDILTSAITEVTRVKTEIQKIEKSAGDDVTIPLAGLVADADMPDELGEIEKIQKNIVNDEVGKVNELLEKLSDAYEKFNTVLSL
ncbi:hypothetical protein HZC27_01100 [Candidatus Roizmanbacteria bacterium]|nr:hypothetical protein [Candidatus Roizmanbacteria bacterium]